MNGEHYEHFKDVKKRVFQYALFYLRKGVDPLN